MSTLTNSLIHLDNNIVFAATTMKNVDLPEKNNMALHVCVNPEEVLKNRYRLEKELELPLSNWVLPWQKHTANLVRVTKEDLGKGALDANTSIMNTDAVFTTEKNTLIGVFTADCIGLVLVDESTPCVCTIHSGWKGTAQAITYKSAKYLIDQGFMKPENVKAYFSPSIQYDSLEVGMEVVDLMKELPFDLESYIRYMPNEKAYIDNQGINIEMLRSLGITQIYPSSYDTKKERDNCFSYRAERPTGEHFTFAYLK
ncbi:MAG: polyphenol oxidase family protein [Bacillota bacterium]|nr:polyphenol oxidase family protein [Bacillota bacterium]